MNYFERSRILSILLYCYVRTNIPVPRGIIGIRLKITNFCSIFIHRMKRDDVLYRHALYFCIFFFFSNSFELQQQSYILPATIVFRVQ